MARNPSSDTQVRTARPQGPKMVYLVFRSDMPADLKTQFEAYLSEVTTNSRALVRAVTGGDGIGPVIVRKLDVETRGPRGSKTASAATAA